MRLLASNLTVLFWAFIFGEVIGYINSDLSSASVNYLGIGVVTAIIALVAVNAFDLLADKRI